MIRNLAGALLLAVAAPLAAQGAGNLLEEARQAYLLLDLDRARDLAQRSLDRQPPDTLSDTQRADAHMLLGTIATLQRRVADARRAFRTVVLLAPRYVPDTLTTPSAALQAFQQAREAVKATTVDLVTRQAVVGPGRPFRATVLVSSLHEVLVAVLGPAGDTVDVLWSGPIREAASLTWIPGRGANGRHVLTSASLEGGTVAREVRVPLTVVRREQDTLPWPAPPPAAPPPLAPARGAWHPLALGLGLGAAVLLAPALAGARGGTPTRLVVAGGFGFAGVFGFVRSRARGPDAATVAALAARRAQWERERRRVADENARRREASTVVITAGQATRHERGRP